MARLRKCPFCRKKVEDKFPFFHRHEQMVKWILNHWCEAHGGVFITVTAATKQECINKWNGVQHEKQESESL